MIWSFHILTGWAELIKFLSNCFNPDVIVVYERSHLYAFLFLWKIWLCQCIHVLNSVAFCNSEGLYENQFHMISFIITSSLPMIMYHNCSANIQSTN